MKPLNYREADIDINDLDTEAKTCNSCVFHVEGICEKFNYRISPFYICDKYMEKGMTYCLACGQQYHDVSDHCPSCGTMGINRVVAKIEEKKRSQWWIVLLLIPVICISVYFYPFFIFAWFTVLLAYMNKGTTTKDW